MERTDQPTRQPTPARPQPTYAAQTLTVTARVLDMQPARSLGPTLLDDALRTGLRAIVTPLPQAVRADVRRMVYVALPKATLSDTQGEYASRLRQAARGL